MTDGITIGFTLTLLDFFKQYPAIGKPVLYFGIVGTFMVFFIMPARSAWVLFRHFQKGTTNVVNKGSYVISNILLILAPLPLIEFIVLMMSGNKNISGLFIPVVSLVPFILYLFFELFRFRAYH